MVQLVQNLIGDRSRGKSSTQTSPTGCKALFEQGFPGQGLHAVPAASCIHRAFEDQAARQPDAIAVSHEGETITFEELDRRANALAVRLYRDGVKPGDAVGLFLRRSIDMVVGILAVLKAGAAYVPQDARVVPAPMLASVIETADIRVILTLTEFYAVLPTAGATLIAIDESTAQVDSFIPTRPTKTEDRCFILFTSGTTGRPNGVQVTHRNVCNIILTQPGDLNIVPGMTVAQLLSIGFDMAAWEIFGALANGAHLLIRGCDLTEAAQHADVIIATPSVLSAIDSSRCRRAKTVAVAGEPCPRPLADEWSSFCAFYNSCGPTETTIVNTMARHLPNKPILSIGKPTPNNTVYVLDGNLALLPVGETGEMWAGGDCVTDGYIGNPELTAERYRPDPFRPGHMMFRTRDLGRWTADGELEHYGRVDDQVKVRGFRVELDSVSVAMERAPGCRKATTLKLDDRTLIGFVAPATVDVAAAQAAVRETLPYYCEPLFILALDDLPRTGRGKTDKAALMAIGVAHHATLEATE
jgi:amino acid adenylation domain-containing protein